MRLSQFKIKQAKHFWSIALPDRYVLYTIDVMQLSRANTVNKCSQFKNTLGTLDS